MMKQATLFDFWYKQARRYVKRARIDSLSKSLYGKRARTEPLLKYFDSELKSSSSSSSSSSSTHIKQSSWELIAKTTNIACCSINGQVLLRISNMNYSNNKMEGVFLTCDEVEGLEDLISNLIEFPLPVMGSCCRRVMRDSLCPSRLQAEARKDGGLFYFKDHAYMDVCNRTLILNSSKKYDDDNADDAGDTHFGRVELNNSEALQLRTNIKEIYARCREMEIEMKKKNNKGGESLLW
jgi:hypothetical protein